MAKGRGGNMWSGVKAEGSGAEGMGMHDKISKPGVLPLLVPVP